MPLVEQLTFPDVIDEICSLDWPKLTRTELTRAAWAYYYFSVQFRESLEVALSQHPDDANLRHLASEECDTANLSPYPGVAAPGERMNHDTFMVRTLQLEALPAVETMRLEAAGVGYLTATRQMPLSARGMSIASYEDGGLEKVFHAILSAPHWDTPVLGAFRHFLSEHIRFDSDPEQGHGALARHLAPDDRILPFWSAFRDLFLACVPELAGSAERRR